MASQPASPQTPPRPTHSRTSSMPSPMSLHRLGIISPLSPFRRQFLSSPQHSHFGLPQMVPGQGANSQGGDTDTDDDGLDSSVEPSDDERTEDSKDFLVARLNGLVQLLSEGGRSSGADIAAMHVYLDKIEEHHLPDSVYALSRSQENSPRSPQQDQENDHLWGPPLSPSYVLRSRFASMSDDLEAVPPPDVPSRSQRRPQRVEKKPKPRMSRDVADQVAVEAEELRREMAALNENFKKRNEEFLFMTDAFIEKAKSLTSQKTALKSEVTSLKDEVAGLKEDIKEKESDLFNLRVQLKGIESVCQDHISESSDTQLVQSIQNWHSDYRALQHKWALNKRHRSATTPTASLSRDAAISSRPSSTTPSLPYRPAPFRDTAASSRPSSTTPSFPYRPPLSPQPASSPPPPVTVRKLPYRPATSSGTSNG